MKPIKYTPDAAEKLRYIDHSLRTQYGYVTAKKVIASMIKAIRNLSENERKGQAVEKLFDVKSDYRFIFVAHNYIFYRIEKEYIQIINIYHEKEDFMDGMFGIRTTSQETLDYWNE